VRESESQRERERERERRRRKKDGVYATTLLLLSTAFLSHPPGQLQRAQDKRQNATASKYEHDIVVEESSNNFHVHLVIFHTTLFVRTELHEDFNIFNGA
jgi:hypothetical protein